MQNIVYLNPFNLCLLSSYFCYFLFFFFYSFSVLLYCKSLASKCGLKGENGETKIRSLLVRSSAWMLQSSASMIEPSVMCSSAPILEPKTRDRVHTTYTRDPCVALAQLHSQLRLGIIE